MAALTSEQKLEIYYWMVLTRTFDEGMGLSLEAGPGFGRNFQRAGT